MKYRFLFIITFIPILCNAQALPESRQSVQQSTQKRLPIGLKEYVEQVRTKNLVYAAEKLNISISDADITSAKVFNDPQLSLEYANNDDHRMQMGQGITAELSKTFSPGKRRARIDLAKSEKELTTALLEDFFRNLRSDATIAYLEAVKQEQLYQVKFSSYTSIRDLAKADSIKFRLGKITQVDALQSRLESGVSYNELQQAKNELYNSYAALNILLSRFSADTIYTPVGNLNISTISSNSNVNNNVEIGEDNKKIANINLQMRTFSLPYLLDAALNNRSDLAAALKNIHVAKKALNLARKERYMDFDVTLGYNYNTEVRNELAPAPKFNGISIGLAIPLKFSNFNRGSVKSAALKASQAESYYKQAEIEIQTEVSQNYSTYLSLCSQVDQFNKGMLNQAQSVIEGKIYSYNRGETSLLEVLNAQRTYNEVRALYIETLFNYSSSLVTLEKSAGIWDIE